MPFKTNRRERTAPLDIVLDTFALPFSSAANVKEISAGNSACFWKTRELCAGQAVGNRTFNEDCMIGQQRHSFAKNRFVPRQNVVANNNKLTVRVICGTSQSCDGTGAIGVSMTLLSGKLICSILFFGFIMEAFFPPLIVEMTSVPFYMVLQRLHFLAEGGLNCFIFTMSLLRI